MSDDRRLIEDYLPIEAISAEASREKSVRKGHISTLHLWWARRPLVACRAAVYGALVPADRWVKDVDVKNPPADPEKAKAFREGAKRGLNRKAAADFVTRLCKYPGDPKVIVQAQRHILEAHAERLTRETGKPVTVEDIEAGRAPRPKVLDMFAGGGAIPLEALRLGCEAYALDLNPVAHIIQLCTLVYPQKYGQPDPTVRGMTGPKNERNEATWGGLAEEVRYWGEWVLQKVKAEIGDLYPLIPDPTYKKKREAVKDIFGTEEEVPPGYLVPVAYLWTRTVTCKNPTCKAIVPLVKQTWLCKKTGRNVALKIVPARNAKRVRFNVVESRVEWDLGFDPAAFSKAGNATCPFCNTVAESDYVKAEGKAGRIGTQPMAVVCTRPGARGKVYFAVDDLASEFVPTDDCTTRITKLCERTSLTVPNEPIITDAKNSCWTHLYGFSTFGQLFSSRQLLCLLTFAAAVRDAHRAMVTDSRLAEEHAKAVATLLASWVDRIADFSCTLCTLKPGGERGVVHAFTRQAIPMTWDFAEANLFGTDSANALGLFDYLIASIGAAEVAGRCGDVTRGSATAQPWSDGFFDAVITDPPYYDNVPYADISDFFYVWLKRPLAIFIRNT